MGFINIAVKVVAGVDFVEFVGDDEVFDEADAEDLVGGVVHFNEVEGGIKWDLCFNLYALAIDIFLDIIEFTVKAVLFVGFISKAGRHNKSHNYAIGNRR